MSDDVQHKHEGVPVTEELKDMIKQLRDQGAPAPKEPTNG